jgi:hypothetical protein
MVPVRLFIDEGSLPGINVPRSVSNLENFQRLLILNLDSNCIEDDNTFPHILTLETLWLNSNKVSAS